MTVFGSSLSNLSIVNILSRLIFFTKPEQQQQQQQDKHWNVIFFLIQFWSVKRERIRFGICIEVLFYVVTELKFNSNLVSSLSFNRSSFLILIIFPNNFSNWESYWKAILKTFVQLKILRSELFLRRESYRKLRK